MRDFDEFQYFCHSNRNVFNLSAFQDAFNRILNHTNNHHQGHFIQLFYALYDFFDYNPSLVSLVGVPPFEFNDIRNRQFYNEWYDFIHDENNDAEGFTTESLCMNLPITCGGDADDGGRWSPTAKMMVPTVALYITRCR